MFIYAWACLKNAHKELPIVVIDLERATCSCHCWQAGVWSGGSLSGTPFSSHLAVTAVAGQSFPTLRSQIQEPASWVSRSSLGSNIFHVGSSFFLSAQR